MAGCGVQGPPRPPRLEHPERITDLKVVQAGHQLELTFTPPVRATDGERLNKPLEIEIYRTTTEPGQTPTASPTATPLTSLLLVDLTPYAQGRKFTCPINMTSEEFQHGLGSLFTFQLRALTRGFRRRPAYSEFSNPAQAVLLDVSAPPEDVRAETTIEGIRLAWNPPAQGATGGASRWRVYESQKREGASFQLLGETPLPDYLVGGIEYDRTYVFKVRAVARQGNWAAESEDSEIVEVTPRDTFPPVVPHGLSTIYAAGAVELIWSANTETDLAGYNVYRREENGQWQKVNSEMLSTPLWRDTSVSPERKYSYRVTALDPPGNESAPSAETDVETR